VAVGRRKIAERIKQIAYDSQVPVVENVPLARALVATVKVGTMIPSELYVAVAEVLAFVIRQRQRPVLGREAA
jgi:flagellar biosynthetic protein FlhB